LLAGSDTARRESGSAGGPKNAYGFDFPDGVDETYPVHVNGDVYTDTKVNSKAIVLAAHAGGEIEVTVSVTAEPATDKRCQ
jgi:hypothetical protein